MIQNMDNLMIEDIKRKYCTEKHIFCIYQACCRQYEMGECVRAGFCNFMHLKPISRELRRDLYGR